MANAVHSHVHACIHTFESARVYCESRAAVRLHARVSCDAYILTHTRARVHWVCVYMRARAVGQVAAAGGAHQSAFELVQPLNVSSFHISEAKARSELQTRLSSLPSLALARRWERPRRCSWVLREMYIYMYICSLHGDIREISSAHLCVMLFCGMGVWLLRCLLIVARLIGLMRFISNVNINVSLNTGWMTSPFNFLLPSFFLLFFAVRDKRVFKKKTGVVWY